MSLSINFETVAGLPKTHYVDNTIYTSEKIFELEKEKLFNKTWIFVCHESEVNDPGDYRVVKLFGGLEIIIARQKDGSLKAYHNICTHRGMKLTELPSGNCNGFQCPYHLWTFNLDGTIRGVTRPKGYEGTGFCKDKLNLTQVKVDSVYGLIFVSLNNDVEPLREFLGEELLQYMKGPLGTEKLEVFHYHQVVIDANWKSWNENNAELYHEWLHYLNRKTTKYMTSETDQRWHLYPNGHAVFRSDSGQKTQTYDKAGVESRDQNLLPTMNPDEFLLFTLFPDIMINIRATVLRIDRIIPLNPQKTIVEYRGLGLKGDTPDVRKMRIRHHNVFWGPNGRNIPEDFLAVQMQSDALRTGALRYSIFARDEGLKAQGDNNLRAYYQEWSKRVGLDPSNPIV